MSNPKKVAGSLADLYHDGKKTLPDAADLFGSARKSLAAADVTSEFQRSTTITTDGNGPKKEFNAVVDALMQACQTNHKTLELIGENLVTTVQDYVRVNDGMAQLFVKFGGKLRG